MFLMCNLGMHNVCFFLVISDTLKFYTNCQYPIPIFILFFPPNLRKQQLLVFYWVIMSAFLFLSQYRLNTNNMLVILSISHIIGGFNLLPFVIVLAFFAHQSCPECCTSVTSWHLRWSTSSTRCSITSHSRWGSVNGVASLSGCKNEKVVITPGHDPLLLLTRQCATPVLHRQRRLWTSLRFTPFLEALPAAVRKV